MILCIYALRISLYLHENVPKITCLLVTRASNKKSSSLSLFSLSISIIILLFFVCVCRFVLCWPKNCVAKMFAVSCTMRMSERMCIYLS